MRYAPVFFKIAAIALVTLCVGSTTLSVPENESVLSQYVTREKYRHQSEQILRRLEGSETGDGIQTMSPPQNWKRRFYFLQRNI